MIVALLQLRLVTEYGWISAASFTSRRRTTVTMTTCRSSTVRSAIHRSLVATVDVVIRHSSSPPAAICGCASSPMTVLSTSASTSCMSSSQPQRTNKIISQVYTYALTQALAGAPVSQGSVASENFELWCYCKFSRKCTTNIISKIRQ